MRPEVYQIFEKAKDFLPSSSKNSFGRFKICSSKRVKKMKKRREYQRVNLIQ